MSVSADQQARSELYAEVQHFYARHIQLMDDGRAEEAGQTFAADCSMLSPPKVAEPLRGRADLTAGLRRMADTLAAEGVRYRRCHAMLLLEPHANGLLSVRCYVQVIKTLPGEEPPVARHVRVRGRAGA